MQAELQLEPQKLQFNARIAAIRRYSRFLKGLAVSPFQGLATTRETLDLTNKVANSILTQL
jgi:hypothetical protein